LSIGDNLKGKNLIVVAAAAFVLIIVLVLVFFPASKDNSEGPEVISKRVKINLQDDTAPPADETKTETAALTQVEKTSPTEPGTNGTEKTAEPPIKIYLAETGAQIDTEAGKKEEAVKKPEKAVRPVEKSAARTPQKPRQTVASKAPARGDWALNVASFSGLPEAKKLRGELKALGYNSYITEFTKDSVRWYRVRVGFYPTRTNAENVGKKIKQRFKVQTPWVVKPPKEEVSAYAG
jgi:cell division septation protein DedD